MDHRTKFLRRRSPVDDILKGMTTWGRLRRHVRLTATNYSQREPTPPFLILFINSICNQTCEHCFYWRNLNRNDDLTVQELERLSLDLGHVENLNLSGGEPFLRKEFGEICRMFIRNNGVQQIYVPTNGSFRDRTIRAIEETLRETSLQLFVCEISLDGMAAYHNRFRGMNDAFERAMDTYKGLVSLQKKDPRLRIHANSTATSENLQEIEQLTRFLHDNCPEMDHHTLALIRGDRKNPSLQGPTLDRYQSLYRTVKDVWARRDKDRYGATMEPILQWAKVRTAIEKRQVVPCRAGTLSGVVYSNGDVSMCETHPPIGNLRNHPFTAIWRSEEARGLRRSIAAKECYCTNEVFLWPSITYQPLQLIRALASARPWNQEVRAPGVPPSTPTAAQPDLKILQ